MITIKTQPTKASVSAYLNAITDPIRKKECKTIDTLMRDVSGHKPVMWGESLVGYGSVEMTYSTGRKVDWLMMGFSSRKAAISLYLTCNLDEFADLLEKLGKYKRGVGCLYIKTLEDVDMKVLKQLCVRARKNAGKK